MRRVPPIAIWASALGLAAVQVVGSFGAAHDQPERLPIDATAVALLLVGPAASAMRDRWPLLAAGAALAATDIYLGLGYPYGPVFLSVVVGLVTAVLAGRRRGAWMLAALALLAFPLAASLGERTPSPSWLHVVVVAGWLAVVLAVADVVRARRFEAAERARRRVSEQRLRIARDLHDVLAHNISMINVQAGVALHLIDEQPDQARTALANIKDASKEALHELRSALDVLRYGDEGAARAPVPGLAELDRLVEGVRAGGLDVRTEISGVQVPLPAAVDLAAYRIVQEALTNVTRHARARSVVVRVRYGDELVVEVVDDGRGGVALPGNGIVGMAERAAGLGGSIEAGPATGGGFGVVASIPVPARS
jgi:signal transduction histidine kinase